MSLEIPLRTSDVWHDSGVGFVLNLKRDTSSGKIQGAHASLVP